MPRLRPAAVDALVAATVTAATLLPAVRAPLGWAPVAIATAAAVPVAWRRRAIVPAALLVGCATTGLSLVDRLPPLPYGMLVCTYTFATLGSSALRRLAVVLTALAVTGSLMLTGDSPDTFGYVGMAYAGAYALGTGTRARENQVALLREQALRLDRDREAAVERERARIARDMHDVLAHSVTMVAVVAEAGPLTVRTDPTRAEMLFTAIATTARDALVQIRRTVGALRENPDRGGSDEDGDFHDRDYDDAADLDAIALLITRTRTAGLDAILVESGQRRPAPPDVRVAVYRIVQESLTNAVRHSAGSAVEVRLTWTETGVGVEVRDNGTATPMRLDGYGLVGMRERAGACGGTLHATALETGGFLVRAHLPLA